MKSVAFAALLAALLVAPAAHAQDGWRELTRTTATATSSTATLPVSVNRRFQQMTICAEDARVHLRRVEVRMDGRVWQHLALPEVLEQGQCADPVNLLGRNRRIHVVRFVFENPGSGEQPGTVVARAR